MTVNVPFNTYIDMVHQCGPAEDVRTTLLRLAVQGMEAVSPPRKEKYVPRPFADLGEVLAGRNDTCMADLVPLVDDGIMSRQTVLNAIARGLLRSGWEKYRTSPDESGKRHWHYRRSLPDKS